MADLDSRSVGNMKQNAQNAEQTKVIRNSNRFPLDYKHPTSHRYGDIDVFYHYFGERGDVVPMRTGHTVRTFTFASPSELDIYMRKQFVHVPMKAIYPNTWDEVLYPLPVDGDIAPPNARANFDVNSYVALLTYALIYFYATTQYGRILHLLDALSYVCSNGSLFAKMNYHFNDLVKFSAFPGVDPSSRLLSFDRGISANLKIFADSWFNRTIRLRRIDPNTSAYDIVNVFYGDDEHLPVDYWKHVKSWHQLHELIQAFDYDIFEVEGDPIENVNFYMPIFKGMESPVYINIEPIIAYQLSCAQFYTNDRVDNIFSANTYRNYIQSKIFEIFEPAFFEFNDVTYIYDVFSQLYTDLAIGRLKSAFEADNFFQAFDFNCLEIINQLFVYRKSLRFGDYFLGARTKPLAVGESSVPITGDGVMIEDITKSAALQRLRYNVNVLGRKINNQLMGLIPGKAPVTPDDIPTSISSQEFNIGKDSTEVSNTGAAQVDPDNPLAVTQHLNSGASDFAFKIEITEPCIILGLVSFSVPRVYSKTVDRFAFHHDRYDMFIPQMQFVGDQEIFRKELFGITAEDGDDAFAYNQRFSEYKQRYNYASGAFVEYLPSWEMITDNSEGLIVASDKFLSPAYSHSTNSEFDRFYKSVSGNNLADYFHFVVFHYNTSTPDRAMAWNPQPLL